MQNMDPNIVPQLLIICPRSELVFLFEQIKVYISAAFIKKILLSNNQVYMDYRKQVSFLSNTNFFFEISMFGNAG